MNHQMQTAQPLRTSQWDAMQAAVTPALPQTEMQAHIRRAEEVGKRLDAIHVSALGLLGRLYGEGQTTPEGQSAPHPAGLSSELAQALAAIEAIAERLDHAVTCLCQFA